MAETVTVRPLYEIAREIMRDPAYKSARWCAGPYVEAMSGMTSVSDTYYADSGTSVVLYALSNLQSWRGETARRVKAELKAALKQAK
jgi:hypothetical protein